MKEEVEQGHERVKKKEWKTFINHSQKGQKNKKKMIGIQKKYTTVMPVKKQRPHLIRAANPLTLTKMLAKKKLKKFLSNFLVLTILI